MEENNIKKSNQLVLTLNALLSKNNYLLGIILVLGIVGAGAMFYFKFVQGGKTNADCWTGTIDPLITWFTFWVAILIGLRNIRKDWDANLEKRLTVIFLFSPAKYPTAKLDDLEATLESIKSELENLNKNKDDFSSETSNKKNHLTTRINNINNDWFILKNKLEINAIYPVAICLESLLMHEEDIRNWAQQIGRQMAGGQLLNLLPFQHKGKETIRKVSYYNSFLNKQDKKWVKHYLFGVYLSSLPTEWIKENKVMVVDDNYEDTPVNTKYDIKICKTSLEIVDNYDKLHAFIESNKI